MKVATIIFLILAFTKIALAECTIEQIEKMQKKGFSWGDIKEICGKAGAVPSQGVPVRRKQDTWSSSQGGDDLRWPEAEGKPDPKVVEEFNHCKIEAAELQSEFYGLRNEFSLLSDQLPQHEKEIYESSYGSIFDSFGKNLYWRMAFKDPLEDMFDNLEDCRMALARLKSVNARMTRLIERLGTRLGNPSYSTNQ